jgi:hypothetical protein
MKKRITLITVMAVVAAAILVWTIGVNYGSYNCARDAQESVSATYRDGWKAGWDAGWKDVRGRYSIPPIAPIAPTPRPGENTFQYGYNRGFKAGMYAASR